jgi:Putative adhesin
MIMKSLIAVTVAAGLLATSSLIAQESSFDRTLNVGATPSVSVATGSGSIHLHQGTDNQVHISAKIKANNNGGLFSGSSDVEARIQRIVSNPPIVQNGNTVTIGERNDKDLYRNINISYDITLPHASEISASSGSGEVEIQDVGNNVKAETGSGSLRIRGVKGTATLGTGSGSIELQHTGPGDVKAETGSGSIHLDGVAGALKASTGSGSIHVTGQPSADWKLSTGSGSVNLALGNTHINLDADTGSGSVQVAQPITMQGNLNRHHITGVINGGGPTVRISTGSGDIRII